MVMRYTRLALSSKNLALKSFFFERNSYGTIRNGKHSYTYVESDIVKTKSVRGISEIRDIAGGVKFLRVRGSYDLHFFIPESHPLFNLFLLESGKHINYFYEHLDEDNYIFIYSKYIDPIVKQVITKKTKNK
jgi:hypothetical protein